MKRKYKSKILRVIHESALAKFEVGAITEERMREFDVGCLVSEVPRTSFAGRNTAGRRTNPVAALPHGK